jgi:tetratricopeptide (TPR) repeat protein
VRSPWAVAALRKATELDPKNEAAYYNLGITLRDQQKLEDAVRAFRKALELDPNSAKAHTSLGVALSEQRKLDEAVAAYRKAIELDPNDAYAAHNNLGNALRHQRKLDEAVAAFRKAIELDPNDAYAAHNNLGIALQDQRKLDEAVAAFRKAIELDPKHEAAYYNLGSALSAQRKPDEAVAAYRKAIEVRPGYAEAHCNLGNLYLSLGQFAQALEALRKGHELGRQQPGWRYPSDRWVKDCERLLALERRLPDVLAGRDASPAEQLSLADLCRGYLKRYAVAALLYDRAFAAEPKLAEVLNAHYRYNAACAALLGAGGKGFGADKLDAAAKARLRGQALDWLTADLAARGKLLADDPTAAGPVQKALQHWLDDADLSGVRDAKGLAELPDAERERWKELWGAVRDLVRRAGKK